MVDIRDTRWVAIVSRKLGGFEFDVFRGVFGQQCNVLISRLLDSRKETLFFSSECLPLPGLQSPNLLFTGLYSLSRPFQPAQVPRLISREIARLLGLLEEISCLAVLAAS